MSTQTIKIGNVDMPIKTGKDFVPALDPNYLFPEITDEICMDLLESKKVLLLGHTGTGKTSLAEQIASRVNWDTLRANMNGQVITSEFVGKHVVRNGNMEWIDGILPFAMKRGYLLILDELDFADPMVLSCLNPVLEKNGKLLLKENNNEVVAPHPDFRIIATANAIGCMSKYRNLYQGTQLMNEAFLDRWRTYKVDYLPPEKEAALLLEIFPAFKKLEPAITTKLVAVANTAREGFLKEELSQTFSLRRLIDWTENIIRQAKIAKRQGQEHNQKLFQTIIMKAAQSSIFSKISEEDAKVLEGFISRILYTE